MDQEATPSASSICPVCSLPQEHLSQHLLTHSKEDIILALTPPKSSGGNVRQTQNLRDCGESLQRGDNPVSSSSTLQDFASGSPVQSGSTVFGNTLLSSASFLPYQQAQSVPAPIISGFKTNPALNTSVLPAPFPAALRPTTYIQNAPPTGISQFGSPPIPILYKSPNPSYQTSSEGNTQTILLQSPQLNAFKGHHGNQNVIGSFGMNPSFMNQPLPLQSDVALPSTSSQIANSTNNLETSISNVKVASDVSCISNVQSSNISSNVSGNSQGQQAVLCILPFAQVQPTPPSASNYYLCGNNLVPSTNIVPDVMHQTGVNYLLGGNASGLTMNNSPYPNTMYYLPSNMPSFGIKQSMTTVTPEVISGVKRVAVSENMAQTSLTKISSISNEMVLKQPVFGSSISNGRNGHTHEEQTTESNSSTPEKSEETSKTPESTDDIDTKVMIDVGNNIKISLPKDVFSKKDRLKELINRELVRAILINDSDETTSLSCKTEDSKPEANCDSPTKNENKSNTLKKENASSKPGSSLPVEPKVEPKPISTFTVSCNTNNTGYIELNSLQINPHLPLTSSSSLEDSLFKPDIVESSIEDSGSYTPDKNASNEIEQIKNHIIDLSTSSHIDALFSRAKSQPKGLNEKFLPITSGTQGDIRFKNEMHQLTEESFPDSSLTLLSPEKNFSFLSDAMFSDITYAEDQVLGAVEEVFANENSNKSPSTDCKSSDVSLAKASTSFNIDASDDINFENQLTDGLPEEDYVVNSQKENNYDLSPSRLAPLKYSKTYFRAKKSTPVSINANTSEGNVPAPFIANYSQINVKLQNISEQADEESVDDPAYEDNNNINSSNETYSNDFSNKCLLREEDYYSEDSKDLKSSVYREIPLKVESGESNGTHTEEIMSLKASETLADSDSERATPSDEVAEMYYGKSFIFAGEPGPPNLTSQEFPPIGDSGDVISNDQVEENEFYNPPTTGTEVGGNDDAISLTLDGNCSILPADTLDFPNLFNQSSPTSFSRGNTPRKEVWAKPSLANWPKIQEESKPFQPFVTTGIIESRFSTSPLASTSGIQHRDVGTVKKLFREDEEYDFEYESDCYGDSDSDIGHLHRLPLDLERWRCNKCNKTFKSLKEKLLHSGHHLPCSTSKGPFPESAGFLGVENSAPNNDKESKVTLSLEMADERVEKEGITAQCSSQLPKTTRNNKSKKKDTKKFKEEKENVEENWEVNQTVDKSEGDFKCPECSVTFQTLDKLYDHRATAFKSRYTCPLCHLEFKKRIGKLRHLKMHPSSELKCSICHRNFESYYAWSQHQLFHMGLIAYECKLCGHKCQQKSELEIHYRKHSGEKPFKCETCHNSFVSSHSLKRHLIIHMEGQETECDVCHKRYKNAVGLTKHKLKMHPKKKKFLKKRTDFMCYTCNEVFHSEKKLIWHQETHERWPKKCQQCGECFIHQSYLTKHIRLKHDPTFIPSGAKKENVPCTICKKVYKRSSISLHMRIHSGVKPYKCNVCSKEFAVKCNYLSHKWVHSGIRDRPYKCKLCERSFHRKRFLEAHVRSHKKIRPYTCNECGKSFIHKSNFQTHNKLHTEEKQHECIFCGKTFFRKYNLNNHVRIHTGETPFECTICRKEFTQKSNFNVHMKTFHVERHPIHEEV